MAGGALPVDGSHIVSIGMRFFMLFSVFYLSLFLSVGLLSARRAVPDGSAAVIVPLGCGFGVSLLAFCTAARGCAAWRRTPTAGLCGPACCR